MFSDIKITYYKLLNYIYFSKKVGCIALYHSGFIEGGFVIIR